MCNRYVPGYSGVLGAALIIAGIIILMSSLPCWMWLAAVGAAMIIAGVVILRTRR